MVFDFIYLLFYCWNYVLFLGEEMFCPAKTRPKKCKEKRESRPKKCNKG